MLRFYVVIFLNLFRIPHWITKLNYMARNVDKIPEKWRYAQARKAVRIIKRSALIFTKAFGTENLPQEGGYVMFANHQGKYDALGVFHTHEAPCSIVMDEARSHFPLLEDGLDVIGGKRLKKDDVRQAMKIIMEVAEEVAAGRRFLIFPEGGYDHNGNEVLEFKPGCFKSAMKAKAPIVPVALIDSYKAFEGNRVGPVHTQVHYLPAITYDEYEGMKSREISDLVRGRIIEKIDDVLESRERENRH